MWKSWGDKYEIIPYNHEKRPRKIKRSNIVIAILVVPCFLAGSLIFTHVRPEISYYYYLPTIMILLSAVVCLFFFFLKWKRNNRECDLLLITESIILMIAAYLAYLVSQSFL